MRRREFITLLGGAAALWPLAANAQPSDVPVVGMLNGQSADTYSHFAAALRLGLKDAGFVEGENVAIEYRWAEGHDERLPAMAVELVNRKVAALVAGGSIWSIISAKAATATIPIVFTTGSDPVKLGFVASLNRPGGNVTGVSFLSGQLLGKRLELASQLAPKDAAIGFFGRPREPRYAADKAEIEAAAAGLGRKLLFIDVVDERDFEGAFAAAAGQHVGALVVHADPIFNSHRDAIMVLAARYALPIVHETREYVTAGGLISYGTSITGAYRQAGAYVGRILKGEKPGDLPVVQSSRFELVINLKTAKALGLTIPQNLLVSADELIE
jgi:putative tryptophan/tyrosine transport system substrate-binding protein